MTAFSAYRRVYALRGFGLFLFLPAPTLMPDSNRNQFIPLNHLLRRVLIRQTLHNCLSTHHILIESLFL